MLRISIALVAASLLLACGGDSESDPATGGTGNKGGTGGTGGTGGSKGGTGGTTGGTGGSSATGGGGAGGTGLTGGAAGNAATGGVAGGAATGGVAGGAATGGSGGTGGGAAKPECTKDEDCTLFSDCCTCQALAPGEPNPPACPATCIQDKCAEQQLPAGAVSCQAGRCVAGWDCDASKVTCKIAVPNCPSGQIPAVKGNCYAGGCVPLTECTTVTSCADCVTPNTACAGYTTQLGNQAHCVSIPAGCNGDFSCGCLGPTVCLPPYTSCSDFSGLKGVGCSCPNC